VGTNNFDAVCTTDATCPRRRGFLLIDQPNGYGVDDCKNCKPPRAGDGGLATKPIAEISEIRVRLADVQGRLAVLGSLGYAYAAGSAVATEAELVEYAEEQQVEAEGEHA
jgi:hypothetical protein